MRIVRYFPFLETKEDRAREIDPKLIFPLKEWLYGFLPDHKFSWDIDESQPELKDFAHRVLYKLSAATIIRLASFQLSVDLLDTWAEAGKKN